MRKIILGLAVTLDGFIEGPNGEFDWCFTDQDYGMGDFLKSIDAILYGRKSYEMMMKYSGDTPGGVDMFRGKKNYIVSSSLNSAAAGYEIIKDLSGVEALRNSKGKNIWLFGGAELTSAMMTEKLVDELWLAVHPILLGSGKRLFENLQGRINARLVASKTYDTGLVSLKYEVIP